MAFAQSGLLRSSALRLFSLPLEAARLPRAFFSTKPAEASSSSPSVFRAAYILDRLPSLTPNREKWELEFQELEHRRQLEQSRNPYDVDKFSSNRAGDLRRDDSKMEELLRNFRPASRTTEADKTNDLKSLNRALTERVYLVVKRKDRTTWEFPWTTLKEGESLRQAADRRFAADFSGSGMNAYFLSNAPIGHLPSSSSPSDSTFFFHALYVKGPIRFAETEQVADYAWVTRDELKTLLPAEVAAAAEKMLPSTSYVADPSSVLTPEQMDAWVVEQFDEAVKGGQFDQALKGDRDPSKKGGKGAAGKKGDKKAAKGAKKEKAPKAEAAPEAAAPAADSASA